MIAIAIVVNIILLILGVAYWLTADLYEMPDSILEWLLMLVATFCPVVTLFALRRKDGGVTKWFKGFNTLNKTKIAIIVMGVLLITIFSTLLVLHFKRVSEKQNTVSLFNSMAKSLMNEVRRERHKGTNIDNEMNKRKIAAIKILRNSVFDNETVVYNVRILPSENSDRSFLLMDYVDECINLYQMNYAFSDDTNDIGITFLAPCLLGDRYMRSFGRVKMTIILTKNDEEGENYKPFVIIDTNNFCELNVPAKMYANIIQKNGQFIFMGSDNNVLDRVRLKNIASESITP